jgi:hypothetical protein
MSISLSCPKCQKQFKAKDEWAGKRLKCPSCSTVITVPTVDGEAMAPQPSAAAAEAPTCPKCKALMSSPGAVICIDCGFDLRTGRVVQTGPDGPQPSPTHGNAPRKTRLAVDWRKLVIAGGAGLVVIALVAGLILMLVRARHRAELQERLAATLLGEWRIQLETEWCDADGSTKYSETVETEVAPLEVSQADGRWKVGFFGQQWSGSVADLSSLNLSVPLTEAEKEFPSLKAASMATGAGLSLALDGDKFTLEATGIPKYVPEHVESHPFREGQPRPEAPPGAVVVIQSSGTIEYGRGGRVISDNVRRTIIITTPGKAGFKKFDATLVGPSDAES